MISLPLAKLSTAQDAAADARSFSWSHDTQHLTVVIDTFGSPSPPSQLLKVVQGTHVRHLIEVERLVSESNELMRTMQEHGVELKNEQLPISALVRCPLLAIRWQLSDKRIRRVQLKFKNSADYDLAYNHLHRLGLRMSATADTQSRLSTPNATRPSAPPTSSDLTGSHSDSRVGPSCPPSRLTEISNRPFTAVTAPTSVETHIQEATNVRPVSAYTTPASDSRAGSASFDDPLRPPVYFARPDSATSAVLDHPSARPSHYQQHDQSFVATESSSHDLNDRPETALLYNRPDTAETILPPRRELPFARSSLPRSSGSDSARPSSRPSTSLMGPPPLPARVASLRPSSSRMSNHEAELPPLPKPTFLDTTQQQPSWMQNPPRTPNLDETTPPSAQSTFLEDQENRPFSSLSNNSPLSYKRSSTAKMPSTRPLSSLSNASQNRRQTESQSPLSTPPTSNSVHKSYSSKGKGVAQELGSDEGLAAYAMQSEDGRRAALNEFVFHSLQNENFVTLLEDMETCWARIGPDRK
ncbi:hypothetical protein FB567DRAFT_587394 [Paraphoma chrysanthemicola]|uniref:Uncharacterized protein n=1 Tax=Paraphoma chrysanthemicola TaxID=798071 RepID=A0A8K0REL5_9PLEO|nr:hypothetical protein FB567DRAFT_587394 [Paraphoma chrysanthemicola]